jgi:hypothetical protein
MPPLLKLKGACTKVLGPDMWAQGHKEYSAWSLLMSATGAILLRPDARDLRILGIQGKLLVEGVMGTTCCLARSYCSPADPVGAPLAG